MFSKKVVFPSNPANTDSTKKVSIFRGLVYALLSGISYSIVAVMVKQMKNLHPGQLALYRFTGLLVMTMPQTVKTGLHPLGPRKFRFLLVVRGVFAGLNIFLNCIAFQYLSLSEAIVIIFSSPVVVNLFARIFFKEPCNIFQSITVILTVVGIVFTTKLPTHLSEIPTVYSRDKIYGLLAAIFSLFGSSVQILITRKMRSVHQSILNFNYSWTGLLESVILTAIFGRFRWQQCGIQSLYTVLLGFFSYSGLTLLTMALQCEYAGPVSTAVAAANIGFAFLWQIIIFHDNPDWYGIIGAILVLFSIILISLGKWQSSSESRLFSCEKFNCLST